MKKPTLFIGSSSEAIDDARALEFLLKEDAEVTLWLHGQAIFTLGESTLEALVKSLDRFDFAVLVVTPDDVILSRDKLAASPRDNVIFELGMFVGRLGRERTFVVCKESLDLKLPTDLAGITLARYGSDRADRNMIAALSPTSTLIRDSIRKLGFRSSPGSSTDWTSRVSVIGGVTHEIESDAAQEAGMKEFYRRVLEELERLPIGINNCGSDPIREIAIDYYSRRLYTYSRAQMNDLNGKIRWYWRLGAPRSYNYEPPIFESIESSSSHERRLMEYTDSDLVLASGGRTGTRSTLEQLLDYHNRRIHGVDLIRKPTILLAWFGGGTKEFLDDNRREVAGILDSYPELDPCSHVEGWYIGDMPKALAHRLVVVIQRLISYH